MSSQDMVMISADEKPKSRTSRLASCFCSWGSKLVVLHQAKIAGLQAAVVFQDQTL